MSKRSSKQKPMSGSKKSKKRNYNTLNTPIKKIKKKLGEDLKISTSGYEMLNVLSNNLLQKIGKNIGILLKDKKQITVTKESAEYATLLLHPVNDRDSDINPWVTAARKVVETKISKANKLKKGGNIRDAMKNILLVPPARIKKFIIPYIPHFRRFSPDAGYFIASVIQQFLSDLISGGEEQELGLAKITPRHLKLFILSDGLFDDLFGGNLSYVAGGVEISTPDDMRTAYDLKLDQTLEDIKPKRRKSSVKAKKAPAKKAKKAPAKRGRKPAAKKPVIRKTAAKKGGRRRSPKTTTKTKLRVTKK